MTVIVPLIAIGVMLSIMLVLYAVARADALKFFVLIPGALVLALILTGIYRGRPDSEHGLLYEMKMGKRLFILLFLLLFHGKLRILIG